MINGAENELDDLLLDKLYEDGIEFWYKFIWQPIILWWFGKTGELNLWDVGAWAIM